MFIPNFFTVFIHPNLLFHPFYSSQSFLPFLFIPIFFFTLFIHPNLVFHPFYSSQSFFYRFYSSQPFFLLFLLIPNFFSTVFIHPNLFSTVFLIPTFISTVFVHSKLLCYRFYSSQPSFPPFSIKLLSFLLFIILFSSSFSPASYFSPKFLFLLFLKLDIFSISS